MIATSRQVRSSFTGRPRSVVAVLFILMLAFLLFPQMLRADESLEDLRKQVESRMPVKSAGGHFYVISEDKMLGQSVSMWAEDVVAIMERNLGLKTPFVDNPVYIDLVTGNSTGLVATTQKYSDASLLQSMEVADMDKVDFMGILEPLCRLLLDRYAIAAQTDAEASSRIASVPHWLEVGVAQNLSPERRGANSEELHIRWRNARMESLDKFLRNNASTGSCPDRAYCGALVQWLESLPEKSRVFELLFASAATGDPVTATVMAKYVPGCETADDVDEAWDKWLLKQKDMVYQPGVADRISISRLEAELLLYEGDSGIPVAGNLNRRFTMRALLDMADEKWIPSFCAAKNQRLQATTIGRGTQYSDVVQAYRRFLGALKIGRDRPELVKLLAEAELKLAQLKAQQDKPKAVEDSQNAVKAEQRDAAKDGQDTGR